MAEGIYYRDPRNPRDIHGPLSVEALRDLVRAGTLRPTDQVSLDGHAWLYAIELEPELFPASSAVWTAATPPWKRRAAQAAAWAKGAAVAAWRYLRTVAEFYWANWRELRQLIVEYFSFLQQPGSRREIRVSADDNNDAVAFDGTQWRADLPDCCVVCGEVTECEWNSEQRSVPVLTWPLFGPILGFLFGLLGWILVWSSTGEWLVLLGVFLGFLLGYLRRGEAVVTVRFRRCREHLNRTRYPSLRIFGKTLIIGVGDRQVWRRFYYGDRGMETPISVPPDYSKLIESKQPETTPGDANPTYTYPTIPLVGDDDESDSADNKEKR
jgi:hypothetical protein